MVAPYFVTTEVEIIGQPPRQLIWVGREWCVSTRGVERRDGTFTVDRKHIWNARYGVKAMAAKAAGIDLEDYRIALKIGRRVHREGAE